MLTKVLGVVGRILVAAGLLLLAFTAYQLWGTGLVEAHNQSVLRSELARSLPPGAVDRAAGLAGAPPTSTIPPAAAPPRAAPAVGRPVGVLDIPRIGLDQVIVEGVDAPQLRTGPGHYPGTPLPGQAGNAAVAGHRTTYAHPFYDLNELGPGDQIVITTPQGIFVYADRQSLVVAPTDVGVLDPTATPQLTLTTCNPRSARPPVWSSTRCWCARSCSPTTGRPAPGAPRRPLGRAGRTGWPGPAATGRGPRPWPGAWARWPSAWPSWSSGGGPATPGLSTCPAPGCSSWRCSSSSAR